MAVDNETLARFLNRIEYYKTNPSRMLEASYNFLDEALEGKYIADVSSPFVALLGISTAQTASAVNESMINLRKSFPDLIQTESDLYLHMADKHYLDRFSKPSVGTFMFTIPASDLKSHMVFDANENCYKAIIPRDTEHLIDGIAFTHEYPIVIRQYLNGVVQIEQDVSIPSPFGMPSGTILKPVARYMPPNLQATSDVYIDFNIDVKQMKLESTTFPISKSSPFKQNIPFSNRYYHARVFHRSDDTNDVWQEMKTTHSDMTFDRSTPTAVLKVMDGVLEVAIPYVYQSTGLVSSRVRVDVYTTLGELNMNLSSYTLGRFSLNLRAIDSVRDTSKYTSALSNFSIMSYGYNRATGGSNGKTFAEMKKRVIRDTSGPIDIPITPDQVEDYISDLGFTMVKNTDALTDRIYLATRKLPPPTNDRILTSANIGISTMVANVNDLLEYSTVVKNDLRTTILSNNVFQIDNGVVTLIPKETVDNMWHQEMSSLANVVNSNKYAYTPFYYVLDGTTPVFDVRVYDLDSPSAQNLSFVKQNYSIQAPVNIDQYALTKTGTGFKLTIVTKSGQHYKQIPDNQIFVQLAYNPVGDTAHVYINGTMTGKMPDGERIFEFDIQTDYDIDDGDNIRITNGRIMDGETLGVYTPLSQDVKIIHATNNLTNNFEPDTTDDLLNKKILPSGSVANSMETLTFTYGKALKDLWRRTRPVPDTGEPERYRSDRVLTYQEDELEINPITGTTLFFDEEGNPLPPKVLHRKGDVVEINGEVQYEWRAGQVVELSPNQPEPEVKVSHEIDLILVDGVAYFSNDPIYTAYRDELRETIANWSSNALEPFSKRKLEKTKIFFYPVSTITDVNIVNENGELEAIPAEQSLSVDYHVSDIVKKDINIQTEMRRKTALAIDSIINSPTLTIDMIRTALRQAVGDTPSSIHITGLGGSRNLQAIKLADQEKKLTIHKRLEAQADGTTIFVEDINVNFIEL